MEGQGSYGIKVNSVRDIIRCTRSLAYEWFTTNKDADLGKYLGKNEYAVKKFGAKILLEFKL